MNDLEGLRSLLDTQAPGLRLGTVESVVDDSRIMVRFSSGAGRTLYGQAPVGAQVVVDAERLISRVRATSTTTISIR